MRKLYLFIASFALLFLAIPAKGQYTNPSGGFDTYHALNGVACTNTNTAFAIAQVNHNLLFCSPAGHGYFLKTFFTFDLNAVTTSDEFGKGYNTYVNTKYGTAQTWANQSIARFLSWGFTGLAVGRNTSTTNPWTTSNPVPYIAGADIAHYATINPQGYSSSCMPKDLMPMLKTSGWGGFTSAATITDFNDPCWGTYYAAYLNGDNAFAVGAQSAAMKHYLLGVADCDADNCHGFGAGPDFVPANGNYDFRLGYMSLFISPVKYADQASPQAYQDGTVYAKKVFHDRMMLAHTNISGINSAIGSAYTTDLTSGTCWGSLHPSWLCPSPSAANSLGSGTGTQLVFSATIQHGTTSIGEWSVYIANDSTIVGGDNGAGLIFGPSMQPKISVNVTNGSTTVTCSGCTSFVTGGAWNGAPIVIGGTNYTVSSVASTSSLTLTASYTGSTASATTANFSRINYTTGVLSILYASGKAPANGAAVTAGAITDGLGVGTGMMDEDCRAGHSSYCGNGNTSATEFFTGVNTTLAADLNQVTKTTASNYATFAESAIATWAAAKGFVGKVLHMGIYALGSWGTPPDKYVLQGLGGNQDVIISSGSGNGFSHWTVAMLDYVHTNWGDVPIIESSYRTSNRDSAFAWPNSPVTGSGTTATATLTLPINFTTGDLVDMFCANSAFGRLQIHLSTVNTGTGVVTWATSGTVSGSTTCNVAYSDNNEGGFSSQNARGLDYKSDASAAPSTCYTASGICPILGIIQWAWQDYKSEQLNWGIVTLRDNPYNAIDNNGPSTFACQAPDAAFSCGGEGGSHTALGAMGDYISPVGQAHTAIDTYLLGLNSSPTGTITGAGTVGGTVTIKVNP